MAVQVLDIERAVEFARADLTTGQIDEVEYALLEEWRSRKRQLDTEMVRFSDLCDRFDDLYYPESVLTHAGATHWGWHPSARVAGRSHVSINNPPVYVDIPASLQSVPPIENFVATVDSDDAREMASMGERLYRAWKKEAGIDLLTHKSCVVKGLYGRTAAKVTWDAKTGKPVVEMIDQPRNLWLGWGQSDYKSLNWAAYVYRLTPESVYEDYGLVTLNRDHNGSTLPYVTAPGTVDINPSVRTWLFSVEGMVEVTDYWYRKPKLGRKTKGLRPVEHETWNAIIVGNRVMKNAPHPEYKGRMPYVPLFNSYIPGVPDGRPELFDIEQLIREKDERITSGSQLMNNVVNAQFWQLVGPEAPESVPAGLKPIPNRVIGPGAGNRIEKIDPWMPEFQLEQFMARLDREMADVSGLNDLLRGLAPASVLSSSKAINALVANYEARIRIKRDLLYEWLQNIWVLSREVWAAKTPALAPLLMGPYALEITAPSLTPRDDMEIATMASNLKREKIWSGKRAMDRTGVDDPEQEENVIREEQTDATLNPAAVQVMAQLMAVLQQLGQQNQQAEQMVAQQQASVAGAENDARQLGGGMQGSPMMNGGEEPAGPPPEGGATGPNGEPVGMAQTMIKEGEATSRILTQQEV